VFNDSEAAEFGMGGEIKVVAIVGAIWHHFAVINVSTPP